MLPDEITNQTYDRIAASFAERYWNITLDRALNSFAALVKPEHSVMDLGCGPGRDIELLRQRGLHVLGADRSAGMLTEAQKRVGGALVQVDMQYLPVRADTLGGVWMCASLLHIPRTNVPTVLAGVRRVLRSEGALYISVQEGVGEQFSEGDGGQRFFTFFQLEELLALLSEAGFAVKEDWTEAGGHSTWIHVLATRPEEE
jgi:ubiquinone/menaquinone biosynthesis C-methylase UbiE